MCVAKAGGRLPLWIQVDRNRGPQMIVFMKVKKAKRSRNRPGVAQRNPGGFGSQISMTFGTWRWLGRQPHAPAALTPTKYSWYSFLLGAESTPGPWYGRKEHVTEKYSDTTGNWSRDGPNDRHYTAVKWRHYVFPTRQNTTNTLHGLRVINLTIIRIKKLLRRPENDNCALLGHYAAFLTQKSAILISLAEGSMKSRSKEKELTGERERGGGRVVSVPILRYVPPPSICTKGNMIL